MGNRWDETWHRLHHWTNGQAPSERLAAQILLSEGYKSLDPSHPLGGPDRGKDALCDKDGQKWVMAVYFPRGQQPLRAIKSKFLLDLEGVSASGVDALAFVTNQELALAGRAVLKDSAGTIPVELYHLERITAILDKPAMAAVRKQFLNIDVDGAQSGHVPARPPTVVDRLRAIPKEKRKSVQLVYRPQGREDGAHEIVVDFVDVETTANVFHFRSAMGSDTVLDHRAPLGDVEDVWQPQPGFFAVRVGGYLGRPEALKPYRYYSRPSARTSSTPASEIVGGDDSMGADARDAMSRLAAEYVTANFPNHRVWTFSFPNRDAVAAELRAVGLIEQFGTQGKVLTKWRLTARGQRWVMSHRGGQRE